MKHSQLWIVMVALVTTLIGCKPSVPSDVMQPEEMEELLYDYHVAAAMARETGGDVDFKGNAYFLSVLKKHGITEAEFDSTLLYYYTRADYLREVYAHVSERLALEAKALGADSRSLNLYNSTSGDTADVWSQEKYAILAAHEALNRFDFHIDADTAFLRGDSFLFLFSSDYIWQSGTKDAVVCLVMKYEGDSITQTTNHVTVSGLTQIRPPHNRDGLLKSIDGFVYLNVDPQDGDAQRLMFINQLQLIRFHNKIHKNEISADVSGANQSKDSVLRTNAADGTGDKPAGGGTEQRNSKQLLPINPRAAVNRVDAMPAKNMP